MQRHGYQWKAIAAVIALLNLVGPSDTAYAAEAKTKRPPTMQPAPQPVEETADVNLPESIKAERALVKKPNDKAIHLKAARAHLAEGADNQSRVEAAQQHAVAVLQDHPNDIDALLLAGQTSLLEKDATSAARYYRAATSADANNATAFLGLGDALTRLGDEPGATAAFARYRVLVGLPPLQAPTNQK